MKSRTTIITNLIRKNISEVDPDAHVILYGSRARENEKLDSDWDILVLTNYDIDLKKERQFRDHLYDLELETGESFSLFAYSQTEWNTKQRISPFYDNVIREGIRL